MGTTHNPLTGQTIFDEAAATIDGDSIPTGDTVVGWEDQGLPTSATNLFTGQAYSVVDITVAQRANAGSAAQYCDVYVVFNSPDSTTDLANAAVRKRLHIQNGRGETKRFKFPKGTCSSCDFKNGGSVTSSDLVIEAECR